MNRTSLLTLIAVAVLTLPLSPATSQPQPVPRRSVFSTLRAGQPVAVRERGDKIEINAIEDRTPGTHSVVEVGDDYIVLRDVAGVTESRIPVFSVRAVIFQKTPK